MLECCCHCRLPLLCGPVTPSACPPLPARLPACRKLAYTRELAASINSGLQKMNDAKTDIGHMKVGGGCCCCAVLCRAVLYH